jgi:hypothetical protein
MAQVQQLLGEARHRVKEMQAVETGDLIQVLSLLVAVAVLAQLEVMQLQLRFLVSVVMVHLLIHLGDQQLLLAKM